MPTGDSSSRLAPSVCIIEEQRLFAPFLTTVFAGAGFHVVSVIEPTAIGEIELLRPGIVFVDVDFVSALDPLATLRMVRAMLDEATICAYTARVEAAWSATCVRNGATCVLTKGASPSEIAAGIATAQRLGAFVDPRFDRPS